MKKTKKGQAKVPIYISILLGTIGVFLIGAFLSGKIINIPFGTAKRGVMGAAGTAFILLLIFLVFWLVLLVLRRKQKEDDCNNTR